MAKNFEGEPIKTFKFIVEESGKQYRWMVPLLNKEGQPNYLIERTAEIEIGEVRILEMLSRGAAKYIDVRKEGDEAVAPEAEDIDYDDDDERDLAAALKKEQAGELSS